MQFHLKQLQFNLSRISHSPMARRIASGTLWSILGKGIGKGSTFVSMVLIARILGKEAFGDFGLIKSTAVTFVTFSAFGVGLTATKYIAEFLHSDKERVGRIVGLSYFFTFFSSLVVASAFWLAVPWLCVSVLQSPHLVGLMRLGAVLLFLATFYESQHGVLTGFQDFRGHALSSIMAGLTMLPIYVTGAYYWGLPGAVTGAVIAIGLSVAINSVFIYHNMKRYAIRYRFLQAVQEWEVLGQFSFPIVLKAVVWGVSFWGCQMMLGAQQGGSAQLGIFYAAMVIYTVIIAVPQACARLYIATLSEMLGKGDLKRLRKTIFLSFSINMAAATAIALPFLFFPSLLMTWCFGEPFREGSSTLVLVSLAAILHTVGEVVDQIMVSTEKCWTNCGYTIAGAATTLLAAFWIIPIWGSIGLALALLSGNCVRLSCFAAMWPRLNWPWDHLSDADS